MIRQRQADQIDFPEQSTACAASTTLLVQTVTITTYPTVAKSIYAVKTITATGPETEGGTVTLSGVTGDPFFATNLGSAIPPTGTPTVANLIGGQWVFIYNG